MPRTEEQECKEVRAIIAQILAPPNTLALFNTCLRDAFSRPVLDGQSFVERAGECASEAMLMVLTIRNTLRELPNDTPPETETG